MVIRYVGIGSIGNSGTIGCQTDGSVNRKVIGADSLTQTTMLHTFWQVTKTDKRITILHVLQAFVFVYKHNRLLIVDKCSFRNLGVFVGRILNLDKL